MKDLKINQLSIMFTALLVGILIIVQAKSFTNVGDVINRNTRSDVFRELQVLKNTNKKLNLEIDELKQQIAEASNKKDSLDVIQKQIDKYLLLTGQADIQGSGIKIVIDGNLKLFWFIDMVNELYSAGAESVSVNSIMLTNASIGFDAIPNGEIILNGTILNKPYVFEAIGDSTVLYDALVQHQGIIERMKEAIKDINIKVSKEDLISFKSLF